MICVYCVCCTRSKNESRRFFSGGGTLKPFLKIKCCRKHVVGIPRVGYQLYIQYRSISVRTRGYLLETRLLLLPRGVDNYKVVLKYL